MIFFDTETCGLHGPTVLIQWAEDDGPVHIHSVWTEPIQKTLDLIDRIAGSEVVGFNLAFDWFHLQQTYSVLSMFDDKTEEPRDCVQQYAMYEPRARDCKCLKPKGALDLMLHARKGPYQSTMEREDIRIKRIPTALAWELAKELNVRIPFKDIYFAHTNRKGWHVDDIKDDVGDLNPDFKDIVLRFAPSSALKALAVDALGLDVVTFAEVGIAKRHYPEEIGYAPYALAIGTPDDWKGAWPDKINIYISHWCYNTIAQKYAEDDVIYTRELYKYFGKPALNDDDSILACMVGSVRWKGYKADLDKLRALKAVAQGTLDNAKVAYSSPVKCKEYLLEVLSPVERAVLQKDGKISTGGIILEEISKWTKDELCQICGGSGTTKLGDCTQCAGGLVTGTEPHPAASRAREILNLRHAKKEIELYDKIIHAGRFHASFKVIGALSGRMSGGDDLNPQGIKRDKNVRACFPLADSDKQLVGGDFAGFEVVIADARYNDPLLREELLSGKKIHGLFGVFLFPPMTYEEILKTKGLPNELDKYSRSKNGVFAMLYGGNEFTLAQRVGIPEDVGNEAYQAWIKKYKVWGEERRKIFDKFCSMRQPNGIGSKVEWADPADYVSTMRGFKRFFTLENQVCKTLFQLAEKPPKLWTALKFKVVRRDREQTACGALRSALFAAAFAIQSANMRAAANHEIQGSGAELVKSLQREIWDLQPSGLHDWVVQPMNVHDEIMCPTDRQYVPQVDGIVKSFITKNKSNVPLLEIEWSNELESWADK
jgi:hypothetical protein